MNQAQIIGRLGKDPEVRSFSNGNRICNFSVATSERWRDKDTGERKESTEWHNVTLQGEGLVKVAENYLRKGSQVFIQGKLQTRKWQDRDGNDRYTTEIVVGMKGQLELLGDRPEGDGGRQDSYGAQPARQQQRQPAQQQGGFGFGTKPASSFDDDLDDDVPF